MVPPERVMAVANKLTHGHVLHVHALDIATQVQMVIIRP
jgi:hypothetical protein